MISLQFRRSFGSCRRAGPGPRQGSPGSLQQLRKLRDEELAEFRDPAELGELRLKEQREAGMPHHGALSRPALRVQLIINAVEASVSPLYL